uniref:Putative DNA-binding protein ESCAROLA n=1 Tax=Rhizophora mucronata TaxID=61149 RepID=A0A2P2K798_RHIMU
MQEYLSSHNRRWFWHLHQSSSHVVEASLASHGVELYKDFQMVMATCPLNYHLLN